MFETFRNAWKIDDLRKRLLFTFLILVLFRLGCAIPVPYITASALSSMFAGGTGDMLEYLNMMSGGALSECTIFALGVQPAINASIIMQLLAVAIPYLENLTKEGEEGQRKMRRITNYVGAGIGLMLSIGYYFIIRNMGALKYTDGFAGIFTAVVIILAFTAGSQLCTWLGNQIDSKGIGNGISLLIFAGIVARWSSVYSAVTNIVGRAQNGEPQFYFFLPALLVLALVAVIFVVVLTNAERRIPVQYAKQVRGTKMYGGQSSVIPMKISGSGVMPLIFAFAIISFPSMIMSVVPAWSDALNWWNQVFGSGTWIYVLVLTVLIFAFAFFYAQIQFNPEDVSRTIQQNGGFIQGIRPGKPTAQYLRKINNRITLFGAIYLTLIAFIPSLIFSFVTVDLINVFSTTGILIVVSVALEFDKQLQSQIMMKNYKGFLK